MFAACQSLSPLHSISLPPHTKLSQEVHTDSKLPLAIHQLLKSWLSVSYGYQQPHAHALYIFCSSYLAKRRATEEVHISPSVIQCMLLNNYYFHGWSCSIIINFCTKHWNIHENCITIT